MWKTEDELDEQCYVTTADNQEVSINIVYDATNRRIVVALRN